MENRDRKRPEAALDGPFLTFSVSDNETTSRSRSQPLGILKPALLALFCWAATAAAQLPEEEDRREFNTLPNAPLIYLDDTILTVGGFGDYLFGAGVHPSGRRDRDLDTLEASFESYVDEMIITRDLDSASLLSDPTARRRMRWRMAHRAGPLVYEKLVRPRVNVSRSEIEKLYQDSLATIFTAPSKREVRQILIAPEEEVTPDGKRTRLNEQYREARTLADSLLAALQAGASFESLARAFSDDSASRVEDGYLGWIYPGNTVYDFDTAAFAAVPGEIRGPVKTIYGYHLIKVERVRPESTIVLTDSVSALIERQLTLVKGRELGTVWADSAIAASDWNFNLPVLERVPSVDSGAWMVEINGRDTMWWDDWSGAWEMYRRQQKLVGHGTSDDRRASLKRSGYPYLYLHTAEDLGFAQDSAILAEARQFLKSEALRLEKQRLRDLQEPPAELVDPTVGLVEEEEPAKPLHLQMVRAADTSTIWAAYRSLLAGDEIESVARRFHDNLREARSGTYDLGWVGSKDLPVELWGKAWILEPGRFTRPIEHDSRYYILRLEDRYKKPHPQERRNRAIDSVRAEYRRAGLEVWRQKIRAGHRVRLDRSFWNRVIQLWRPE